MLAMVVVIWVVSLLLVAPLGAGVAVLLGHEAAEGAVVAGTGWTLTGGLVLLAPVEGWLARVLLRARRPRASELRRLAPSWARVCQLAGADPDRYLLRVDDSEAVNGFALGGHVVAVTAVALRLPDDMLEAVLAHELGHHRALDPLAAILGWWFLLPFLAAERCLFAAGRATRALTRAFSRLRERVGRQGADATLGAATLLVGLATLTVLGALVVVVLAGVWLPLLVAVRLAQVLSAALSRAAERAADRHASELGFGPALVRVLHLFPDGKPHWRARLLATHPSPRSRIAALERLLG